PPGSRLGLHPIGLDGDPVLEARLGVGGLLERLGQALARLAVEPAVIVTPQAAILREAVAQISPAMGAVTVQEPVRAALVLVEDEVLAHQTHGLRRMVVQLGYRGDWHPVA